MLIDGQVGVYLNNLIVNINVIYLCYLYIKAPILNF